MLIKADNNSPRFPADPGNFPAKHTATPEAHTQLYIQPLPVVPEFSEQQKHHGVLPGKDITQVQLQRSYMTGVKCLKARDTQVHSEVK